MTFFEIVPVLMATILVLWFAVAGLLTESPTLFLNDYWVF